jgi:predicted DNA-binding transcriptional regulator AlpA
VTDPASTIPAPVPTAPAPAAVIPLLVDAAAAAALCGVSRATWFAWHSAGKCPLPVRPGGQRCVRWRRDELSAWVGAGCPARDRWQTMRGTKP